MTGVEFLARLAAITCPPRYPLTRFAGVLAPRSAWRREVVPKPRERRDACAPTRAREARLSRRQGRQAQGECQRRRATRRARRIWGPPLLSEGRPRREGRERERAPRHAGKRPRDGRPRPAHAGSRRRDPARAEHHLGQALGPAHGWPYNCTAKDGLRENSGADGPPLKGLLLRKLRYR